MPTTERRGKCDCCGADAAIVVGDTDLGETVCAGCKSLAEAEQEARDAGTFCDVRDAGDR